jgi:hypothetical protein
MQRIATDEIYLSTYKPNPSTKAYRFIIEEKLLSHEELMQSNADIYRNYQFMDQVSREEYQAIVHQVYSFVAAYNKQHQVAAV